jgi:hypothetical protein
VYVAAAAEKLGVPEIAQLEVLSVSPEGKAGVTEQFEIEPPELMIAPVLPELPIGKV